MDDAQPIYQHTQHTYVWLGVAVLVAGTVALAAVLTEDVAVPAILIVVLITVVVALVTLSFAKLTTTVTPDAVTVAFTWGWPRRVIGRDHIVSHRIVRNRWLYGWGVRWIPHGMLWNVWGLDGVELQLRDGRRFRIGTDEPERLDAALSAAGIPVGGP